MAAGTKVPSTTPHKKEASASTNRDAFSLANVTRYFVDVIRTERNFLLFIAFCFLLVGVTYQDAFLARWIGFLLAGYSAIANDSIQTIGTFIASNRDRPWWSLWLFIAGLFVVTILYSYYAYDQDVSFERLRTKGFDQTPQSFGFLQVAAPIFLMVLTRLKMPVSTTFLLLSSFATKPSGITAIATKSILGYVIAFAVAGIVWYAFSRAMDRRFKGPAHPAWVAAQWLTSGALWCIWIAQDAANIAVYLPRKLDLTELWVFIGVIVVGLGILFRMGGEGIQEIVDEKSSVVDVRAATIIDLVYSAILFVFILSSKIPMSTTWVFIGLLSGRELAMSLQKSTDRSPREVFKLMIKDAGYATIGLIVSLILAVAVNPVIRNGFLKELGLST
jgi:hypothetical protein